MCIHQCSFRKVSKGKAGRVSREQLTLTLTLTHGRGGVEAPTPPHSRKSAQIFWPPELNSSHLLVSEGDWFHAPPPDTEIQNAHIPYRF